jgi:4-hydroxy-3-polyprenylbenzoate decarboxylase
VIEGDTAKNDILEEGPFGEWTGYYCSKPVNRPCVRVKAIMHRNNPILCNAPQHRPVDETVMLKAVTGSAAIWESLRLSGIPEIRGVWQHEGGAGVRFTVISIQRYPGHARPVRHVASSCQAGPNGCGPSSWTTMSIPEHHPGLWAMRRASPGGDVASSAGMVFERDPMVLPDTGNFSNRILVDACIPRAPAPKAIFLPVAVSPVD